MALLQSLKRKAVAAAGDPDAEMEPALEAALVQVADDFISGAVAFGSGLARRRKTRKLEATDVSVFLERTWYDLPSSPHVLCCGTADPVFHAWHSLP